MAEVLRELQEVSLGIQIGRVIPAGKPRLV